MAAEPPRPPRRADTSTKMAAAGGSPGPERGAERRRGRPAVGEAGDSRPQAGWGARGLG